MSLHMYLRMYVCMFVCLLVCMYVCMLVCLYLCMCVYECTSDEAPLLKHHCSRQHRCLRQPWPARVGQLLPSMAPRSQAHPGLLIASSSAEQERGASHARYPHNRDVHSQAAAWLRARPPVSASGWRSCLRRIYMLPEQMESMPSSRCRARFRRQ